MAWLRLYSQVFQQINDIIPVPLYWATANITNLTTAIQYKSSRQDIASPMLKHCTITVMQYLEIKLESFHGRLHSS